MTAPGDAYPVTMFRRWDRVPVFHLHGDGIEHHSYERDDGALVVEKRFVTACGRTVDAWGWTDHPDRPWPERHTDQWERRRDSLTLRRDHAEAIGRLCEQCSAHG